MGSVIPPPTKPAGSNTEVQYNNDGKFGASSSLKFDTDTLEVANAIDIGSIGAGGRLECSQNNQDLQIKHTGSSKVEVTNATNDTDTDFQITGPGTGAANLTLSGPSGSITFTDGTSQTTAATGGYTPKTAAGDSVATINDMVCLSGLPPWGVGGGNGGFGTYFPQAAPSFNQFVAGESGSISAILVNCDQAATSANSLQIGIYSDDDGRPDTRLTLATFDMTSTGEKEQTSLTGTATLVEGTQYWIGNCETGTAGFKTYVVGVPIPMTGVVNSVNNGSFGGFTLGGGVSDNSLPSSVTATDLYVQTLKTNVIVAVKF